MRVLIRPTASRPVRGAQGVLCASFLAVLAFACPCLAFAGDTAGAPEAPRVLVGGALQPRLSFIHDKDGAITGAGLRRARLRLYAFWSPRVLFFLQVAADNGSAEVWDGVLDFRLRPSTSIRVGRFVGAQPASFALQGLHHVDGVDFPVIASHWARHTRGADGRDFGVELVWRPGPLTLRTMWHNGDGAWTRLGGNVREDPRTEPLQGTRRGFAVSQFVEHRPTRYAGALVLGGHAEYNRAAGPATAILGPDGLPHGRDVFAWSGHVYWHPRPGDARFRLKADTIGIVYQPPRGAAAADVLPSAFWQRRQHVLGHNVLAAWRPRASFETFAQVETLTTDLLDVDPTQGRAWFASVGGSFSLSAWEAARLALEGVSRDDGFDARRLTLVVTRRSARTQPSAWFIVAQAQYVF